MTPRVEHSHAGHWPAWQQGCASAVNQDSWCHYQRFLERKHSADLALTDAMVALTLARPRCNLHHLKCRKVKAYDMRLPGLFLILRVTAPLRTATYHVSYIFHYTVGQVSCMLWIWGRNACHAKHCLSCCKLTAVTQP